MPRTHQRTHRRTCSNHTETLTDMPTANRDLASRIHPDDRIDPAKQQARSRRTVTVNMREHVTSWLHHRGLLTDGQYEASEKLRADYERCHLGARVTMDWNPAASIAKGRRSASAITPGMGQIDAKRRFDAALAAVGPGLADICWRVICAGEGMAVAEKSLGWPTRSGRVILGLALDRLVAYYGIGSDGT